MKPIYRFLPEIMVMCLGITINLATSCDALRYHVFQTSCMETETQGYILNFLENKKKTLSRDIL